MYGPQSNTTKNIANGKPLPLIRNESYDQKANVRFSNLASQSGAKPVRNSYNFKPSNSQGGGVPY